MKRNAPENPSIDSPQAKLERSSPGGSTASPNRTPPSSPCTASVACLPLPRDVWNIIFSHLPADDSIASRFIKFFSTLPSLRITKPSTQRAARIAAKAGYFTQLMWFHDALKMPWTSSLCVSAAAAGRLDALRWAIGKGCEWDSEINVAAAGEGHLEILRWTYLQGRHPDRVICAAAAEGGHMHVIQWAVDHGAEVCSDFRWDTEFCNRAAKGGQLEVLKWARARNLPWDKWTSSFAAEKGNLPLLQWHDLARLRLCDSCRLQAEGCPWDSHTCTAAANAGHAELLKWAHSQGCPWDISMQHVKQLPILKWAVEQGLEMTSAITVAAARNGYLDVLKWAREQGCPWIEVCDCLRRCPQVALIFLRVSNANAQKDVLMQSCIYGRLEILQWSLAPEAEGGGGAEYFERMATAAARNNQLHVLQWLHQQGFEWDDRDIVKSADKTRNPAMIEFVISKVTGAYYEGTRLSKDSVKSGLRPRSSPPSSTGHT